MCLQAHTTTRASKLKQCKAVDLQIGLIKILLSAFPDMASTKLGLSKQYSFTATPEG